MNNRLILSLTLDSDEIKSAHVDQIPKPPRVQLNPLALMTLACLNKACAAQMGTKRCKQCIRTTYLLIL